MRRAFSHPEMRQIERLEQEKKLIDGEEKKSKSDSAAQRKHKSRLSRIKSLKNYVKRSEISNLQETDGKLRKWIKNCFQRKKGFKRTYKNASAEIALQVECFHLILLLQKEVALSPRLLPHLLNLAPKIAPKMPPRRPTYILWKFIIVQLVLVQKSPNLPLTPSPTRLQHGKRTGKELRGCKGLNKCERFLKSLKREP